MIQNQKVLLKKIGGMTLLEVMLVLAIGASFILFAIRQYQQFRAEASFNDLKTNVDVLFQAVGRYYQANCRNLTDFSVNKSQGTVLSTSIMRGDLAPAGPSLVNYNLSNKLYAISINNTLKTKYLPNNWPTYVPDVDTTTVFNIGSVASFNGYAASLLFLLTTKNQYACWNFHDNTGVHCTTPDVIKDNTVAFWLAQVSVHIANDPTGVKTLALFKTTGASCASGVPGSCDKSATPHYLIWQQLPTKSGSRINSDLWESQTQEVLFNQAYTHDIMYEMALPANSTYITGNPFVDPYYLCGN